MTNKPLLCAALLPAMIAASAGADDYNWIWSGNDSKNQYNLLNPTPRDMWRPFYLDRGSVSPYTIDAGAFAADISPVQFSYDSRFSGGMHDIRDNWNLASSWLKLGVCNHVDVEVGWTPYEIHRLTENDRQTEYGSGNFLTRAKINLLNNDGGPASLALLGTVEYPTASRQIEPRNGYTGGPGLAFQYNLTDKLDFRINSDVSFSETDRGCWDECYCEESLLEYIFCPHTCGYFGFDTSLSSSRRDTDWDARIKLGAVYRISKDIAISAEESRSVHGLGTEYQTSLGIDLRF